MKRADSIDAVVGHNICILRMTRDMSQQELADKIGVSFQQLQKYEKGANRISAGRLWRLANAFNVPIQSFYESLPAQTGRRPSSPLSLISNRDTFLLARAFTKINDRAVRRSILGLV